MNPHVQATLDDLRRVQELAGDDRAAALRRTDWALTADETSITSLLSELLQREPPRHPAETELLGTLLKRLLQRSHLAGKPKRRPSATGEHQPGDPAPQLAALCRRWTSESRLTHPLLALLASGSDSGLTAFAELMVSDPPRAANDAAVAFSPLFQRRDYSPALLFPRLLDGLKHRNVAGLILDLANFLNREQSATEHPAAGRAAALVALLGELVQRLAHLEEQALTGSAAELSPTVRNSVEESLALAVSLCDAVALIGDRSAIGKLYQTLELKHRRLRTEAAGALARFGEPAGIDALRALSAEPVARLRVLAYAEELGLLDKIPDRYQTTEARAESELVLWLAQPAQMGIPPSSMELFDTRTQYWPSYDEPVECFLFRFTYRWGDQAAYSNIGISGPLTHALRADLQDLSPADIYSVFAGWQAEHSEIYAVGASELAASQRVAAARLERRLLDEGYESVEPLQLGCFFEDRILVARARREGRAGHVLVDAAGIYWYPGTSGRGLQADDLYNLYKGRQLLQAFNEA